MVNSQSVSWIDPYAVAEESVTSVRDEGFRETVLTRDSACTFTGSSVPTCQAAYLINSLKGDNVFRQLLDQLHTNMIHQYLKDITSRRARSSEGIVSDINDQRNRLVNAGIHQVLNKTRTPFSILCTPTWKLGNQHVPFRPNLHQSRRDDPNHHLMTLQSLKADDPAHNINADLEWSEGESANPSKLILNHLYACTVVKLWGVKSFKEFLTREGPHTAQNTEEKKADEIKRRQDSKRDKRAADLEAIDSDLPDIISTAALWNFTRMANPELAPTFEEEQLKRQEIIKPQQMAKVREWQQSFVGL
ncbi:hypothetical protein BDP27DRAFT_1072300 [Rhodocollybia butyracea]|uniref:Uncharacterized protein n=1 Tax=Rhodocollybia butyracea TaxID=206335 RepID=A0A9P5U4Q3_9AGAR|nr:hypothetical protein BDP27DRAFT_1072300 [Rhodocollybia butyracea]